MALFNYAFSPSARASPPELVGRARELARLRAALDRLGGGERVALELVGEPGIGKTALLDALCARADDHGCVVLRGRAGQFERDMPFRAFADALDDRLGTLEKSLIESLGQEARLELARLFPALPSIGGEQQAAPGIERHRAHHVVRSLLGAFATRRPVVLAIDDVHWVDEASQELLSFLLRRPPRAPVLLALAYLRGQAPARIMEVLERAVVDGACERLEIGPLGRDAVDELLATVLPDPRLRSRAFEDTGGNPFYLWQLALHPDAIPTVPGARSHGDGVPASVLATIRRELSALHQTARAVLRGAAIAGDPFEPQLAAAGADVAWEESLRYIDELLERELIRPGNSPRRFQFRHPVVRRAIYEGTPAGWRIGAHTRVVALLREAGAPAAALAPHLEAAAQPGDEQAIATLAEAGRATSSRAPASAARWLRSAVQLLPAGEPHDRQRVALLVPMATALGAAGRLEASRDAMREALMLLPATDPGARTRAAIGCATMEFLLRRKHAGERLLLDTLAGLRDDRSSDAAEIMFALGAISCFDHDQETARMWCRKALEISRHHRLELLEASVTGVLAYSELRLGNVTAARALVRHAAETTDRVPDVEVSERLDALFWLAPAEYRLERFDDALMHAERGITIARATGQDRWLSHLSTARIWALCFAGRISQAGAACDDVVEMARLTGDLQWQTLALAAVAETLTLTGKPSQGLAAGRRAVEVAGSPSRGAGDYASVTAQIYLARCLLASGRAGASRRTLLVGCGGDELTLVDAIWRPLVYETLTLAEIARGDLEAADRWAACAESVAASLELAGRRGRALHARAAVMLARGHAAAAARVALDAATATREAGARVDEGRALSLAGRALTAAGERAPAAARLQQAATLLDDCGAIRLRNATVRDLRTLGHRARRVPRRSALSAREREIADLVATGKTNKEIAAELHLSVYTIENHLRKVFAKLGVRKRAAVAAGLNKISRSIARS